MKKFSGQLFHAGINLFLLPGVTISEQSELNFQHEIHDAGLDISAINYSPNNNGFTVIRNDPSPLQIVVAIAQPPVCQLAILAPTPKTGIEMFYQEAEVAVKAYQAVWPASAWQVIRCDATIRELHETESEHAFKELWESRLHQSPDSLKVFGKPIIGGGLRLVLAPLSEDKNPMQIEVKIESFLADVKKIFVETQFTWLQPSEPSPDINVRERMTELFNYVENNVLKYISGDTDGNNK